MACDDGHGDLYEWLVTTGTVTCLIPREYNTGKGTGTDLTLSLPRCCLKTPNRSVKNPKTFFGFVLARERIFTNTRCIESRVVILGPGKYTVSRPVCALFSWKFDVYNYVLSATMQRNTYIYLSVCIIFYIYIYKMAGLFVWGKSTYVLSALHFTIL